MDSWLVAVLVLVAYGALVILLDQFGVLQKLSITAVGPLLIWRTLRFRKAIDWIARPRRMWQLFGDLSIALVFLSMALMVGVLLLIATLAWQALPDSVQLEKIIGLPAINPLIPLWYGTFGLAVAIIVHEGCHGILSRAESIAVRSVGLLLFVVPIGAFVEPDEAETRRASLRRRLRIFSVGPSSNLVLALVCGFIFSSVFVASAQPTADGAYVVAVTEGSPAWNVGLRPNTLLTAIHIENRTQTLHLGNFVQFSNALSLSKPGDNVTLFYRTQTETGSYSFTLGAWPHGERETGYVGVSTENPGDYAIYARPGARIANGCGQGHFTFGEGCIMSSVAGYLQMPVRGLSPLPPERQWLYEPTGAAAGLGGAFWTFADAFYWLFWLNIMVGTFNAVPMLPLDGGHMYRDGVLALLRRFSRRKAAEPEPEPVATAHEVEHPAPAPEDDDFLGVDTDKRPLDEVFGRSRDPLERRAHTIAVYTSLLMFALIVWQIVGPQVAHAVGG